jgi:radical SAM protein with 4Fe4S-binding SPASM domain
MVKRFHQHVRVHKGPVNTGIYDLLKGNVFQVQNQLIEKFMNHDYSSIKDFIDSLESEELIITVEENTWIPIIDPYMDFTEPLFPSFVLELDEKIDLDIIRVEFNGYDIHEIHYYGSDIPYEILPTVRSIQKEKNFSQCVELSAVSESMSRINEEHYHANRQYHSCWGRKVAVIRDLTLRPCIYSHIVIGNLKTESIETLMEKARTYWGITKDKVEKCNRCELKYACYDCRELAYRTTGNIYSTNPSCKYDPKSGRWG